MGSHRQRCALCAHVADELRRGLCPSCDAQLRALLAIGEACELCGVEDPRVLRPARLGPSVVCLCRNHAAIAEGTSPPPQSLEELEALLARVGDRRSGLDRRDGDRRRGDRRGATGDRRLTPRFPDKGDRRVADRRAAS